MRCDGIDKYERSPRLIDLPRCCDADLYRRALDRVVAGLAAERHVRSVHQVGSTDSPGISDLDLLVVVDDASASTGDPLARLTEQERYVFTHSCFLLPESLAGDLTRYTTLAPLRHLYGDRQEWSAGLAHTAAGADIQRQTAVEFLVKNLLDLFVQLEYGVLKVRVLLQHAKGLRLDLAPLQLSGGSLAQLVERAVALVDRWFDEPDRHERVVTLSAELLPRLREAAEDAAARVGLYAPRAAPLEIARNMTIHAGPRVALSRRGVLLPRVPGLEGRRHFNAQHRVNSFRLEAPLRVAAPGSPRAERFFFLRRAKAFADSRFPRFAGPVPPLYYRAL